MNEINSILHLHVGQMPQSAQALLDEQKSSGTIRVDVMALNEQTAKEALGKIFANDAVCVWSEQTPFAFKN